MKAVMVETEEGDESLGYNEDRRKIIMVLMIMVKAEDGGVVAGHGSGGKRL